MFQHVWFVPSNRTSAMRKGFPMWKDVLSNQQCKQQDEVQRSAKVSMHGALSRTREHEVANPGKQVKHLQEALTPHQKPAVGAGVHILLAMTCTRERVLVSSQRSSCPGVDAAVRLCSLPFGRFGGEAELWRRKRPPVRGC